ncbi:hypothetical protein GRW13_23750 [Escherichia coli]|nr:hypothetical protein [Escherichia coli]
MAEALGATVKGLFGGVALWLLVSGAAVLYLGGDEAEEFGYVLGRFLIPAALFGAGVGAQRAANTKLVGQSILYARVIGGACLALATVAVFGLAALR